MPDGVCPDIDDCVSIECSCCLCVNELVEGPSKSPIKNNEFRTTSEPSQKESSESTVGVGTLAAVSGAVSFYFELDCLTISLSIFLTLIFMISGGGCSFCRCRCKFEYIYIYIYMFRNVCEKFHLN